MGKSRIHQEIKHVPTMIYSI